MGHLLKHDVPRPLLGRCGGARLGRKPDVCQHEQRFGQRIGIGGVDGAVCHALPDTIVTTHMSHCYPQGANLNFIFITRMQDAAEFKRYHTTILDAIQKSGAAISHHHGIGKMFAPWLEGYIGEKEYGVFRVLKNYFDPYYIMNPGGTIGLDLKP